MILAFTIYLTTTLFLLLAAFAILRIFVRRDYRLQGKLTPISSFLQLLLFFMHAMSAYIYMEPLLSNAVRLGLKNLW